MSEMRHPSRIENSVALVKTMVEHIFSDHKAISLYGVKRLDASYDIWVEYAGHMITAQSLTRDIILPCTDPDEDTALNFSHVLSGVFGKACRF